MKRVYIMICSMLLLSSSLYAVEDRVELETTFIKGNKELPQVLYIVPWKDAKQEKSKTEIIVLHSLFGDTFEPVTPQKLGQQ
jgi:hypothetical protein